MGWDLGVASEIDVEKAHLASPRTAKALAQSTGTAAVSGDGPG